MSKKQQKEIEKRLIELVNDKNNDNRCGECNNTYPTWASYNIGIFLCGRCASVHKRMLGPPNNISHVLSLTLDQWSTSQVDRLSRIGNKKAKKKWNPKRVPFPYDGDEDKTQVEQYIRDKYINGRFRDDEIDPQDYENDGTSGRRSRSNSNFSNIETRSRSDTYGYRPRTNSLRNDLPKLTHRKLTTFEYTQYKSQLNTITGYGYSNQDSILESLLLSNGNIETAIDILELDSKINPNQTETAPELPKRRPVVSKPVEPKSGEEWWKNNQQPQITGQSQGSGIISGQITGQPMMGQTIMGQTPTGQPQIYQYTDPVTGQISYIDANGQQYLDPNNPAHQQQLMQQTNPQYLQQQHTKQNILSLYGQQNSFMTNVAAPTTQQQQQQQQQAPQAQPQTTGLAQPQMSLQSQQLLQQSQMMSQPTSNGFGPQATGFGQQYQQQYYQGQPGQPGQGYGQQFQQWPQ